MAGDKEGKAGGKLTRIVDLIDHPFFFALAITLMVVPMMAFIHAGFARAGWTGPAALFHHP